MLNWSWMVSAVEKSIRDQSEPKLWFKCHAGRITAPGMKVVCKTNPALPSQDLIWSVCYPEVFRFTSSATCWGCEHQNSALEHYKRSLQEKHDDFSVTNSGLVLKTEWPYLVVAVVREFWR